jgi:hypothetical protein
VTRQPPRFALPRLAAVAAIAVATTPSDARAAESIRKGPYVVDVSDTTADVRFELASRAPAKVQVSIESDAGAHPAPIDAAPADPYAVHFTGLSPATRYAYAVRIAGAVVGTGHFATAPSPDSTAPVTFLVYGDDRTDPEAHAAVVRAMMQVPSDFLVNTGDLVQDAANPADWQSFFDVEAPILRDRPILAAVGNHELYNDQAGATFAAFLGVPGPSGPARLYRSARFGSVRLFFLNAMDASWASGDEREWLERELAHADDEPGVVWRIAVLHHGPRSAGPHGPNAPLVAAGIPAMLAAHHVDLVLSGHDHIYDRGTFESLKYIVTGGGGAPLYPVQRNDPTARKVEATYHFIEVTATREAMRLVVSRADGSVLERCGFARGRPWDCDPPELPPPELAAPPTDKPASWTLKASRCSCRLADTRRTSGWFGVVALVLLSIGARARRSRRG